ncbi:MAG: FAD-binding oxidoreductase [Hyphomicrobiales bacterium]|nr:MAG: FAD-binding oxidoreductase [Hyphomicrobiales bacterium]
MSAIDTVISALKSGVSGTITVAGDAGYDGARAVMYGGFDLKPGVIFRPDSAAGVQNAVTIARDAGVEIAVRSGGHSNAGHSSTEGGLVIDLRGLKAIELDVAGKTVWAETGVTAEELTLATTDKGLVVGFGDTGSVGIGGITLGGGVGYLARKHGLTIDSVLAAEIVTADGMLHRIDASNEPDLFWAVRGGGGNFGIVTRFKYRLADIPAFTGGMICLPATAETVAGFVAAASAAPEELSTICNVMPAPPMPFLPAALHGQLVILGMLAFAGDDAAAQKAIAPFRALATPYADFITPGPYMSMYPPEDADYHPTAVAKTLFMNRIGGTEAQQMLDTLTRSDATFRVTQIRVLGGAVARVPADATAYAHRSAPIMVNVAAFYTTPADKVKQTVFIDGYAAALTQEEKGAYVNFLGAESPERINAAYPAMTLERLRRIKRQYDPGNLFRLNQNIVPAD